MFLLTEWQAMAEECLAEQRRDLLEFARKAQWTHSVKRYRMIKP